MNLKHLSDEVLHLQTVAAARKEREAQIAVLHHLLEVERRMLHAKRGHSDLVKYCVEELGYTKTSAQRRVDSMRLMKQVPQVEGRIVEGSLSLTHLSDAQTFFRKEEIKDAEEKKAVLDRLVGKSVLEAQRQLMTLTDTPEIHIPERLRVVSEELTEVRFVIDQETLSKIEELKALLSHASPGMGVKEALQYGLELALKKHRMKQPDQKSLVPVPVLIYHRDQGACTYVDPKTGRRCGSRRFLERDHVLSKALGGSNDANNLRLLCRTHNQLHAVQVFGPEKMSRYLPRIQE